MDESKKERLASLLDVLTGKGRVYNQQDFANKIGKSKTQLSEMLKGKLTISEQTVHKIVSAFPDVNKDWILTGLGEIFISGVQSQPILTATTKKDKISTLNSLIADIQHNGKKRDKIHFIPLMNIDAVGGSSNNTCDTPEYIEELIPVTGARESSICLPVSGDSMMPIFLPGDLVVIDEVVEWSLFLEMGQYYVIALKDNRRLIKKITYSETDRKSNFLLLSENPKYPPVELPKTLIHRVFIVTQKHQRLTM